MRKYFNPKFTGDIYLKKYIIVSTLVLILITSGLFAAIVSSPISAEIEYGSTDSDILENPNVTIRGTSNSDETTVANLLNTLTFSDNVKNWYIVYPDISSAEADGVLAGQKISVTYESIIYPDVTVFIGDKFDASAHELYDIIGNDTTIFFKPGNYSADVGEYSIFFKINLSLIGLESTPESVVFDLGPAAGYIDRSYRILIKEEFYISNITFDAKNRSLISGSHGQHYIHVVRVDGDDGFEDGIFPLSNDVFNNVVIKGLNNSTYGDRNVAINVIHADAVVFNNVTIEDWTSGNGYAPIQVNNSSENIYFNNLTLNDVHGTQGFIKIEDGTTYTDYKVTSVFFTGTLVFNDMITLDKTVYIQNYKYTTVTFHSDIYRYAQLSEWPYGYIVLSNIMPTVSSSYVIFDLKDNTFVVEKNAVLTEEGQIQNIVNIIAFIQSVKNITTAYTYNIKYEVGESLGSIILPEITSSYTGYWENIKLNIIPVSNLDNDIRTKEIFTFDQTDSGSSISLPANNNRYSLFNIDFNEVEKCTLQEVIEGIAPLSSVTDPYESLYSNSNDLTYAEYSSSKSPLVLNATDDTFQSCIFTSLVNKIEITGTFSLPTWYVGDERYLTIGLTNTNDNSFTYQSITGEDFNKNTANDGLPIVKWFSTDNSIATVDIDTGKVTTVGLGTVTIVAKAADEYNNGEVEKPWATYTLISNPRVYSISYNVNGGSGSINDETATYGSNLTLDAGTGLSMTGHYISEWNTALDGSGTSYNLSESFVYILTEDLNLYAIWTANNYDVSVISDHVSVSGVKDGDSYVYGSEIEFSAQANNGYFDVIVMEAIDEGEFSIVMPINGTYSITITNDITIKISASALPVDPDVYNVIVNYDSDIISINGVPSSRIVAGGSMSVSITSTIPIKAIYVTVTMGGNTIDAFNYSTGSLTSGTVSIESVTGDVTITIDYEAIPIASQSNGDNFTLWIILFVVLTLILLFIFFLFYSRREVIFEDDHVTVTIDGVLIENRSKIHKGEVLVIQTKAEGYKYTISNATGSDGKYTVDKRRGNVVISSADTNSIE